MVNITDGKVVLLSLLSSTEGFWTETAIPNLPTDVKIISSTYDKTLMGQAQVVVGDLVTTENEWMSGKDYLMKGVFDIHVYTRIVPPNTSKESMGQLKQERQAMEENIRTILIKHSDRPKTDVMFALVRPRTLDRDLRNEREVMLHSVMQAEIWSVETYT